MFFSFCFPLPNHSSFLGQTIYLSISIEYRELRWVVSVLWKWISRSHRGSGVHKVFRVWIDQIGNEGSPHIVLVNSHRLLGYPEISVAVIIWCLSHLKTCDSIRLGALICEICGSAFCFLTTYDMHIALQFILCFCLTNPLQAS